MDRVSQFAKQRLSFSGSVHAFDSHSITDRFSFKKTFPKPVSPKDEFSQIIFPNLLFLKSVILMHHFSKIQFPKTDFFKYFSFSNIKSRRNFF